MKRWAAPISAALVRILRRSSRFSARLSGVCMRQMLAGTFNFEDFIKTS